MRMKQITAATMQEALQIAKRELGDDAVLLDTKKSNGSGITVTFAVDEQDPILFDGWEEEPAALPEIPRATAAKVEIAHPAFAIIEDALTYHAVPPALANAILMQARAQHIPAGALQEVAETMLANALSKALVFKPIATAAAIPPARVLMLVGPPGAGKTSAIAKIATELTLHKRRLVLISADNERMGATDTLQGLADLLKCEFRVVDGRNSLKELVKQYIGQAWVLVDSSGVNIYEFKQLKALGELAGLQGIEPILTCPAGMDKEEAMEMAGVFDFLSIERMIVTRLDATRRLGSVFATLATGGYALANMSQSPGPMEACLPMSAPALARLMLRQTQEHTTH